LSKKAQNFTFHFVFYVSYNYFTAELTWGFPFPHSNAASRVGGTYGETVLLLKTNESK
jgi:hypothetical protein